MLTQISELVGEIEMHCPCGARPESLNTHPHVSGCPVAKLVALLPSIDREIEAGQVEAFRNGHLEASMAFTDAIRAISPDAKNEWHQTWPPEEFIKAAFQRYAEAHDAELRRRWEGEKVVKDA